MRLFVSVIATAAMFFAASAASAAVEFTVLNGPGVELAPGESVTLEIIIRNPGADGVNGVGASVFGYDESVADFTGGEAVSTFLNAICVAPGSCFGGFTNAAAGALVESAIAPNPNRVQIFNAVSVSSIANDGSADQGLDNVQGSPQALVTFQAIAPGVTTLTVGTGYQGDVIVLPGGATGQSNTSFTITVVPEPGTALLMGLGLAGLAFAGRRD